ncbi:uncharacterized protein LOC112272345 [Brachypodium distachyon]|uniref:uncharacterized protein LOC112272345 n=1 Tax=Brachypodium distachyon TaxID=15368 RepID=UPI000D0DCF01|nr:uncharacterized protein LOC112272345 [Brachypodium distachyon]|eukprot:XP_024318634.1 uncharacterized protein LOC112272345 [Brachypodium distachyon]
MESKSFNDCDAGVRIMDKLITAADAAGTEKVEEHTERLMLVKQLFRSASSSSHLLKNLLRMLLDHPRRSREMRQCTARLVWHLIDDISLEQFPWGVQCISSLLIASSSDSDHPQKGARTIRGHRELVLQGLCILSELAMDQGSCRVMSHTDGLIYQVMRPLSSDLLHLTDHADVLSSQVVDASLQVECRWLSTTAPGDDDANLCTQILSNQEAMSGIYHIVTCCQCGEERRVLAMKILTLVGVEDTASTIEMLLGIILTDDNHITTRGRGLALAGENLRALCFESASNAKIISQKNYGEDDAVDILSATVLAPHDDETQEGRIAVIAAAGILEGLCSHYNKEDGCFEGLRKAMADLMPKETNQARSVNYFFVPYVLLQHQSLPN